MSGRRWWRRLIDRFRGRRAAPADAEEVRGLFQHRYHALRLLLAANTKALEVMAAMERAAAAAEPFGMTFVRSRCTAAGVSVFQMVRHLDTLAPGKYELLFTRLQEIQRRIEMVLEDHALPTELPLLLPLHEVTREHTEVAGAKMATLGEIAGTLGIAVPRGFVITAAAFAQLISDNQLQPEIERLLLAHRPEQLDELFALSSELQALIMSANVPDRVTAAIESAAAEIAQPAGRATFALRSSALGEDSAEASFAGQYHSLLNLRTRQLVEGYLEVAASKYTPQAMHYRLQRGLRDDDVAMSVGCMEMVDARAGGVAYTGNPNRLDDDRIFISSAWGLPKAVVDGRFGSDLIVVERATPPRIADRRIGDKRTRFVLHRREGIERAAVPDELSDQPSLTDDQALEIARIALRLEEHFRTPVDVEWAIDSSGELVILQCRPLAQAAPRPRHEPPDGLAPLVEGGVAASPGAAAGPVHRVERDGDALTCPEGAVLVLEQPLPRWAALLGRAAAVVAEEGGVAGHLATVAREFGVPALLGVGPLDSLENRTEVTIDADGLAVYAGRVDALLESRSKREAAPPDTPVRRTLREALEHIVPLNLLDPDGLDFKPASCRTLHDITRFCHEQAVREIFAFGTAAPFPEYAAKQLHHNVPMQWWILDLGGGLEAQDNGKYVRLENIACRPMLALWEGMTAVPWDGPPAISGRGLASVLFEATANPALATPFKKPYANRNYFIVSEHFMNLQSRFGFHFSNVEVLAGPRPQENYLSFSFKGGAADLDRKAARARFIGDLMAELGFEVDVTEDVVSARRTGLDSGRTEDSVRVLGYLLMHTRQLDMVMGQPAAVEHYRNKIRGDIERVTSL